MISPVLPNTSEKILKTLNKDHSDLKWNRIGESVLKSGSELGEIEIENPDVVNKSYPELWKDLEKAGFKISSTQ